jgi:hypothetical protein
VFTLHQHGVSAQMGEVRPLLYALVTRSSSSFTRAWKG